MIKTVAVVILCAMWSLVGWDVHREIKSGHIFHILQHSESVSNVVDDAVRDKQKGVKPLLAVTHDALHAYATLGQNIHQQAIDNHDNIFKVGQSATKMADDFNTFLVSLTTQTNNIGNASVMAFNAVPPTLKQATLAFGSIHDTADDLDDIFNGPQVTGILNDSNVIMDNAAKTSTDGYVFIHGRLYPVKRHGWSRVGQFGEQSSRIALAICRITGNCVF